MADFARDADGQIDDRVRLELDGADVRVAESYEVHSGVFTQPSAWSLRLGHGGLARELMAKARPGAPFRLYVGSVLQQTGVVDGSDGSDSAGSATEVTIHGRDSLAPLHDADVRSEISIKDATFRDLVEGALARTVETYVLHYSNDTNRKVRTGVGIVPAAPAVDVAEQTQEQITPKSIRVALQAKIGEGEYTFVKRQLDRAGLFLWAAASADGTPTFVLSAPTAAQPAVARILRQRGASGPAVTVTNARFQNRTEHRYSEVIIYARSGSRKFGRSKINGGFTDPEMLAWGFNKPKVFKDVNVATIEQAEFYARRMIAESIRSGWQLVYTVKGHVAPSLAGGGYAVWSPDTVVDVDDQEYGLKGAYYVEQCIYRGGAHGRTTELTLMRPDSLVFGIDEGG